MQIIPKFLVREDRWSSIYLVAFGGQQGRTGGNQDQFGDNQRQEVFHATRDPYD